MFAPKLDRKRARAPTRAPFRLPQRLAEQAVTPHGETRARRDFSAVPTFARGQTDGPAPQSQPQLAPQVPPPAPSPAAACSIRAMTAESTPDGSPKTRTRVGVNEEVAMAASVPTQWTASSGSLFVTGDRSVTWTAPDERAESTITATPAGAVGPCSVSFSTVPPSLRVLKKINDLTYASNLAGAGFLATVELWPLDVSFARIQVREEQAEALAAGYYDEVLNERGAIHRATPWEVPSPTLRDTVGTIAPGTAGPFMWGVFEWRIPQHYRRIGDSGPGFRFDTPLLRMVMHGSDGAVTATKEDERADRKPGPGRRAPAVGAPAPDGSLP